MQNVSRENSFNYKYILVAFARTEDACTYNIGPGIGRPGTVGTGNCGPFMVIVNEAQEVDEVNPGIVITKLVTIHDFHSAFSSPSTTSAYGSLVISCNMTAVVSNMLQQCGQELDTSLFHATFALVPIPALGAVTISPTGAVTSSPTKVAPVFFNLVGEGFSAVEGINSSEHHLHFTYTHNTSAQMPNISRIWNLTLTHKDGGLQENVAYVGDPKSSGIRPRAKEDAANTPIREERQKKSPPMKTLGEALDSLQEELRSKRIAHKGQVQKWIGEFRDNYKFKIDPPTEEEEIPLKWVLNPGEFAGYKIDNRKLPFEQPEIIQGETGVRAITFPDGYDVTRAMDEIMSMSKRIAEDYPDEYYRINHCYYRRCRGLQRVFTAMRKVQRPKNSERFGHDTGQGAPSNVDEVPKLRLLSRDPSDIEVLSVVCTNKATGSPEILDVPKTDPDSLVVYGDRETPTALRYDQYFKTGFSGLVNQLPADGRASGSEYTNELTKMKITKLESNIDQGSEMMITVRGSIKLWSDLNRNPEDVRQGSEGSDPAPYFWKFPEFYPVYIELEIGAPQEFQYNPWTGPKDHMKSYYFKKSMHVKRIITEITGSVMTQTYFCGKDGEVI